LEPLYFLIAAVVLVVFVPALYARIMGHDGGITGREAGAIANFIPEFWAKAVLQKLRHALVFAQPRIANRDYEGEIKQAGDTVHITGIGEVTIVPYTRNTDLPPPEVLDDDTRALVIDQSMAFNFLVDDVDAAQAAGNVMDAGMESAAFGLRDLADQFVASHYTEVAGANLVGSDLDPVEISAPEHAYFWLVRLGVRLDVAKVPADGRWVVVPPWFGALLALDKRFTSAADSGSSDTLRNGQAGRAAGFDILVSHNAPHVDADVPEDIVANDKIIAGHRMGFSYAEQINKVETYRPERRFADAVKGLHLYGGKLIYPQAWAVLSAVDGVGDTPPETAINVTVNVEAPEEP
jgi:hypothetical protein